jgi:hypothetical protein
MPIRLGLFFHLIFTPAPLPEHPFYPYHISTPQPTLTTSNEQSSIDRLHLAQHPFDPKTPNLPLPPFYFRFLAHFFR